MEHRSESVSVASDFLEQRESSLHPELRQITESIAKKSERVLYMPVNLSHKLPKVLAENPDIESYLLDGEDAIVLTEKDTGRDNFIKNVDTINLARQEKNIIWGYRINKPKVNDQAIDHGRKDLEAVLPYQPDFLVIPKVRDRQELDKIGELCAYYESPGQITPFIIIVENLDAAGSLPELLDNPRVIGAIPGAQDYGLDLLRKFHQSALNDENNIKSPRQIANLFMKLFPALEEVVLKLSHVKQKIALAPSSFIAYPPTSKQDYAHYRLDGFDGRTGINPKQFPSRQEAELPMMSMTKKEKFFPQIPYRYLLKYVKEAKPGGYFNSSKNESSKNPDQTIPTEFGKPIVEMMFLLLVFHLAEARKKGNTKRVKELEEFLPKAQAKLGYNYQIDLNAKS